MPCGQFDKLVIDDLTKAHARRVVPLWSLAAERLRLRFAGVRAGYQCLRSIAVPMSGSAHKARRPTATVIAANRRPASHPLGGSGEGVGGRVPADNFDGVQPFPKAQRPTLGPPVGRHFSPEPSERENIR